MFARGASPGKVKTWSYDEDEEDFTKGNNALLILAEINHTRNSRCNFIRRMGFRATWRPIPQFHNRPNVKLATSE